MQLGVQGEGGKKIIQHKDLKLSGVFLIEVEKFCCHLNVNNVQILRIKNCFENDQNN